MCVKLLADPGSHKSIVNYIFIIKQVMEGFNLWDSYFQPYFS